MSLILDGTNGLSDVDGTAGTPAIRGSDANTGVFFGTDIVGVSTGGSERVRVDASGNVGIGTSSPSVRFHVDGAGAQYIRVSSSTYSNFAQTFAGNGSTGVEYKSVYRLVDTDAGERARIDSSGNFLIGRTNTDFTNNSFSGALFLPTQGLTLSKTASPNLGACLYMNRATVGDGNFVEFAESAIIEGTISVSGTTVSYNGGHLSRWAQMLGAKDESLVKGTVLSNLDEMNVYTDAEGNPVDNEQLNKVKVSDVEGDANVAGVFVNWEHDDAHNVDEINMAMTGDMIIRIAEGVTVQRGDLLMSAGDGTAKPQGDDIVRSKTIAKVTSTHVTCTYADGSFCVPCVLMAC